jgi:hypothetical protein
MLRHYAAHPNPGPTGPDFVAMIGPQEDGMLRAGHAAITRRGRSIGGPGAAVLPTPNDHTWVAEGTRRALQAYCAT